MLSVFQNLRPRAKSLPVAGPQADATKTLESILRAAAREEASDVHLEPKEDGLLVRFRIDGEMREHARLSLLHREPVIARGKIFGGMDITERRLPQDGRSTLHEGGKRFHLRLSTLPTVHGESLVIRLLDQTMPVQSFEQLGFTTDQAATLHAALAGPAGLIFLTGPTGSGKSTTLHAALQAFDPAARVIHTLEDPVEYEFAAIRQTEIREKTGLTFANSLRALLRQNPDILLVGETRDTETAQLAVRAALTGHLVLSTLHTNDALAAIPRLNDLGVESFLLAASLRLVAAQRLVRRLCERCKHPHPENDRLRELHGLPHAQFFQAAGCEVCRSRGYHGRLAIHEVFAAEKLLPLISSGASLADFAALRDREGWQTLWRHGLQVAARGDTTIEEVARVL